MIRHGMKARARARGWKLMMSFALLTGCLRAPKMEVPTENLQVEEIDKHRHSVSGGGGPTCEFTIDELEHPCGLTHTIQWEYLSPGDWVVTLRDNRDRAIVERTEWILGTDGTSLHLHALPIEGKRRRGDRHFVRERCGILLGTWYPVAYPLREPAQVEGEKLHCG
ncbi:hypothetical protein [Pendulispora albinea]|uniref:Lipoprotein n=1 Tax=Pendulispora albinea TaxID=2741071 RepID=A0ABZ2M9G1_9BACT